MHVLRGSQAGAYLELCSKISCPGSSRDAVGRLLLTRHKALRIEVNVYLLLFVECRRFSVGLLRCLLPQLILYEGDTSILVVKIRIMVDKLVR